MLQKVCGKLRSLLERIDCSRARETIPGVRALPGHGRDSGNERRLLQILLEPSRPVQRVVRAVVERFDIEPYSEFSAK